MTFVTAAAGGSPRRGTGHLFMALDVKAFADFDRFTSDMDVYLRALKDVRLEMQK